MKTNLVHSIVIMLGVLTMLSCSQESEFLYIERDEDGTWTIHCANKTISDLEYDDLEFISTDGLIRASIKGNVGVIDTLGNVVIKPIYMSIHPYKNCLVVVTFSGTEGLFEYGKGFIADTIYNQISIVSEKYLQMEKSSPYAKIQTDIMDRTNSSVIASFKSKAYMLSENTVSVEISPNKHRFYYLSSKEFSKNSYSFIHAYCVKKTQSTVIVSNEGHYGFCDLNGNEIIAPFYDGTEQISDKYIGMKKNNKWCVFDNHGKQILKPEYDYIGMGAANSTNSLQRNLFVCRQGNYGIVNDLSEIVVPFKYDYIRKFSEGLSLIKKNGLYGYCNTEGEQVINPKYSDASDFSEGKAWVAKDSKWYVIDNNGNERPIHLPVLDSVPSKHCTFSPFRNGLSVFRVMSHFGLIDSNHNVLIYDQIPRWDGVCYWLYGINGHTEGLAFDNPFRKYDADDVDRLPQSSNFVIRNNESLSLVDSNGSSTPLPGISQIISDYDGHISVKSNGKKYVFLSLSDFLKKFRFD